MVAYVTALGVVAKRVKIQPLSLPIEKFRSGRRSNGSAINGTSLSEMGNRTEDKREAVSVVDISAHDEREAVGEIDKRTYDKSEADLEAKVADEVRALLNHSRDAALAQEGQGDAGAVDAMVVEEDVADEIHGEAQPSASQSESFIQKVIQRVAGGVAAPTSATSPLAFVGIAFAVITFTAWLQFFCFSWTRHRAIQSLQAILDTQLERHVHLLGKLQSRAKEIEKKGCANMDDSLISAHNSFMAFLSDVRKIDGKELNQDVKPVLDKFCALWSDVYQQTLSDGSEDSCKKLMDTTHEAFQAPSLCAEIGQIEERFSCPEVAFLGKKKPRWISSDEEDAPDNKTYNEALRGHALRVYNVAGYHIVIANLEHLYLILGLPIGIALAVFLHAQTSPVGFLVDLSMVLLLILVFNLDSIIMSDLLQGRIGYVKKLNEHISIHRDYLGTRGDALSVREPLLRFQTLPSLNVLVVIQAFLQCKLRTMDETQAKGLLRIMDAIGELFAADHGHARWLSKENSFDEVQGVAALSQFEWLNGIMTRFLGINPNVDEPPEVIAMKMDGRGLSGAADRIAGQRVFLQLQVSREIRSKRSREIVQRAQVLVAKVGTKEYSSRPSKPEGKLDMCIWTTGDIPVLKLDVYDRVDGEKDSSLEEASPCDPCGRLELEVGKMSGKEGSYSVSVMLSGAAGGSPGLGNFVNQEACFMQVKIHVAHSLTSLYKLMGETPTI